MTEPTPGREADPHVDTDADPDNLNPRTGAAASGQVPREEEYADTDADPANLNPRTGEAATEEDPEP